MRAPFQILAIPYFKDGEEYVYAIFKRSDMNIWQAIAGGGESNETPEEAVRREALEEAGINKNSLFVRLSTIATIPAVNINGLLWGNEIVMIPEIVFGIKMESKTFNISDEHLEYKWVKCEEAMKSLKYDSNKSAVWELNYRLKNGTEGIFKNIQNIKNYYN